MISSESRSCSAIFYPRFSVSYSQKIPNREKRIPKGSNFIPINASAKKNRPRIPGPVENSPDGPEPVAGQEIVHGSANQNHQPKESRAGENPREPTTVARVHEIEDYEQRFKDGNREGDNGVQTSAKVHKGNPASSKGQADARAEDHRIELDGKHMPAAHTCLPTR